MDSQPAAPQGWARTAVEIGLRVVLLVGVNHLHPFSYDVHRYWQRMHPVSWNRLPYRDFLWEFPPLTVIPVLPARLLPEAAFTAVFALEMVACEYGSLSILRRALPGAARQIECYWYAVAIPLALQGWFRLDFLSVLPATIALVWLLRGRNPAGPIAVGFLAKLWPALLLVALVWQRSWRHALTALVAVGLLLAGWYAFSPSGFSAFLRYRHGSGFEIDSVIGSVFVATGSRITSVSDAYVVRAGEFGWADPALTLAWAGLVAACAVGAWRRPVRTVPLLGGLIVALLLLSRILSPQYLVWVVPFVAVAWADGDRTPAWLFAGSAWITALMNLAYASFVDGRPLAVALVVLRNLLFVAVAFTLLRAGFSAEPDSAHEPVAQDALRSRTRQARFSRDASS